MARSADRRSTAPRLVTGALATGAVVVLAGCSTTQDEAARLRLNAARIRASELRTVVRRAGDAVRVTSVSVLPGHGASTFVVDVRDAGRRAVTDLPISVGVRVPHRGRLYLNARSTGDELTSYYDAHLPVVSAGDTLTWVYTADRALPARDRPFAFVGGRPSPPARLPSAVPVIDARVTGPEPARAGSSLEVSVHNTSTVPQYQLQVYAVARRAGRYVAAAGLTVTHLGSHRTLMLRLPVTGDPAGARFNVTAYPTIFQ